MFEVFVAILAAIGAAALAGLAYGALLMPVGRPETLEIRLTVTGDAAEAEPSIRGLHWLHRAGLLNASFCILDHGLTPQGRANVEYLCSRCFPTVKLIPYSPKQSDLKQ